MPTKFQWTVLVVDFWLASYFVCSYNKHRSEFERWQRKSCFPYVTKFGNYVLICLRCATVLAWYARTLTIFRFRSIRCSHLNSELLNSDRRFSILSESPVLWRHTCCFSNRTVSVPKYWALVRRNVIFQLANWRETIAITQTAKNRRAPITRLHGLKDFFVSANATQIWR